MRYEDASHTDAFQGSQPIANDDLDSLPAGSKTPATGNLITGEGTQTGSAGADMAAGAHVAAIAGKGGEDTSFSGGKLSVAGEFGKLSVDADGNYSYMANAGIENVRDRFTYTLADNNGATDTGALIVEIGKTPVVIKANAQQIVPGPDGVVTLPPGVELSDIRVVGRNLVIDMPDGTQLIIVDGAVFVPQLVINGVEIPSTNLAALLIGQEPQPAAGEAPQSGGGNFDVPVPPLDPGVPLGDLIPPTEYTYQPPEPEEVFDTIDRDPEVTIQPDGQPASVNAVDTVDEAGLPARDGDLPGEPEGSGEEAAAGDDGDPSEATGGVIHIAAPDGVDTVTINGVLVTGAGQVIAGEFGTLVITSVSDSAIGYSYVLNDNTSGDATHDDFTVVLTDDDGDQAEATLTIDIIDDVPTARDDTDAVVHGQHSTDGNVMTGVGTTSSPAGIDTVGADDAEVTGVHAGTSGSFTAVPDGGVTIVGQFGDLTLNPDGSYTYTLHAEVGDGGNDVFTYQLTDGDGDTENATLTIAVPPDLRPTLDVPNVGEAGTVVDEAGLPPRGETEPAGTGEAGDGNPNNESDDSEITTGTINFTPGDAPATVTINGVLVTGVGQTFAGDYGTLTITGYNPNGSITYSYTLNDNVDHDSDLTPFEEFDVVVTDDDGDVASDTLRIDIVDDTPVANDDTDSVTEDGQLVANGNVISGVGSDGNPAGGDLEGADDSIVTNVDGLNPGVGSAVATPGGVAIVGQYGTLVIQSDGSYSYTLDNTNPAVQALSDGDTLLEQFEYTLLDNDGDTDTAVLTITINGDDDVPTVDVPTRGEDGTLVDEAGLPPRAGEPEGTGEGADGLPNNESDDSEVTSGVITYTPGDGATTITIGGVAITGPFPQSIAGDYGTLTITAHDPVAHSISYTYTLEDNVDHDSDATPFETFEVVVSDSDGNPADDATGDLIIDIVNDAPIARDDTDSVVEGAATNGNVLTGVGGDGNAAGADTPGADDYAPDTVVGVVTGGNDAVDTNNPATVGVAIVGTYGTLVLNADGSYTYTATAVDPPEDAQDVFTYTIVDNDGNLDSATLTIDVIDDLTPTVDVPTGEEAGTLVDEAGLPPRGETPGTGEAADGNPNNESDDSEITSGTINFTPGDEPATVRIDGVVVTGVVGQAFAGDYGTLVIDSYNAATGVITYTYTLEDNVDHDSDATPFETFTVSVTDVDNDVASADLTINILNDAPIARDDTDSVVEGASTDGNVLTGAGTTSGAAGADTPGADNYAPDTVVGVVTGGNDAVDTNNPATVGVAIVGTYGTLTLNADGSYTYEVTADSNPPQGAVDEFVYTIRDGDGDLDSATLSISVEDVTLRATDDEAIVNEAGLPTGSDPASNSEIDSDGQIVPSGGTGPYTFTLNGSNVGSFGTLTLNPDGSYTYTLTQRYDTSPDADNGTNTEDNRDSFSYTVTDADGNTTTGTILVDIIDDVPSIDVVGPTAVVEGATVNGTWSEVIGADQPGATTVVVFNGSEFALGVGINTGKGTLTVNADGTWSFQAANNLDNDLAQSISFSVKVTDGDGDIALDTQTVNIDDGPPPTNSGPISLEVDDDALSNGNNAASPDEVDSDTITFNAGSDALTVAFGNSVASLGGGLTWTRVNDTTIEGRDGGNLIVTLSLSGELSIAAGASGGVTVTATLADNYDSHPGVNVDDLQALGNVLVVGSDQDGDSTSAQVNVSVSDDLPDNDVAGPTSVVEGQSINGTWTVAPGADQPGHTTVVTFGGVDYALGTPINTGLGTLTVLADGTWSFQAVNNLDNDVLQQISFTLKTTDADDDVATDPHTVTINDGPPPTGGDTLTLEVDDDALSDGNNAVSTDETDSGTLTFTAGSDALTSFAFAAGTGTLGAGLTWTRVNDTTIEGWDGPVGTGTKIVTLSLSAPASIAAGATGDVTVNVTLHNNYDSHPGIDADDLQALGSVTVVAADHDGDSATGTVSVGISDDVPEITTPAEDSDLNTDTLTATGDFAFSIGADNFPGGDASDYLDVDLSGTVDNVAITVTQQPTFVDQVGDIATYEFTFTYDDDGDPNTDPVENGGTVAFNVNTGGYTVTLNEGFTSTEVVPVSDVLSRTGYNTSGSSPSQYEIVVSELDTPDPLFVQFTAISGPSNNTFTAGGNAAFVDGELFAGPESWASISNTENGVAGDTIQSVDVLNIDFFDANPRNPDATPNPAANPITVEGLTLDLAKLGVGEDMVVLLKLVSASDPSEVTTRVVIIPYSEIYTEGETLPDGYTGTLGNDLGLVVIESNDFNAAGEDYVISGAQMIMSTQNISGSGILLNGDTGDTGSSDVDNLVTFASSGTVDQDVIKIVDIGLIRTVETAQEVQLTFDVTVTDADGDTATDQFVVNPTETLLATPFSSNQEEQLQKSAANSNTLTLAAAVAASGLAETQAAAAPAHDSGNHGHQAEAVASGHQFVASVASEDDSGSAVSSDMPEAANESAPVESSSHRSAPAESDHSVDDGSAKAEAQSSDVPTANDQGPASSSVEASPAALAVGMPSVEALQAVGVAGNAQHGGSVEQIVADALGQGNASAAVDALLNALPGGNGAHGALANMASAEAASVPAWHMSGHGAFAVGHDMMFNVHAAMQHHDAVQPVANG